VLPNVMVLSGPTGVGAAKLMADNEAVTPEAVANGEASPVINTATVEADNQAVSSALINGDVDIAAVATNVAASLSAKSEGAVQVLAVNTLGVLYILEKGNSVQSMADLEGRTVYATGQGANPEFVLNYLLTENGVDPANVDIQWMTAQEVTAKMASSEDGVCLPRRCRPDAPGCRGAAGPVPHRGVVQGEQRPAGHGLHCGPHRLY